MNSRERVLCALNHVKPDRAPTDLQAVGEIWDRLGAYFKTKDNELILNSLEIDCRWLWPKYSGPASEVYADGCYEGWGGSILRKVRNQFGSYEEVVKYAVDEAETAEDIDKLLKMPDPDDYDYSSITEMCKYYKDYFLFAGCASMFYYPTMVRSMEKILIDMAINPELAHALFKKSVDWHLAWWIYFICMPCYSSRCVC